MLNLILIPCFRTSPKYRRYEFIKLIFLLPSIFYKYNLQSALFKEFKETFRSDLRILSHNFN